MKIKKSDFKRICPMAEMQPGELGVLISDGCLVQAIHTKLRNYSMKTIDVVSIGSTRVWRKSDFPKTHKVGILLEGTGWPNDEFDDTKPTKEFRVKLIGG